MNNKCLAGIFILILLVSCNQNIKLDEILSREINFKLTIVLRDKNTSDSVITKSINKDSEIIKKLRLWLKMNPDGWASSMASWAPSDISLIGADFRLLIHKDGVVIGFTDRKGKAKQLVKKVDISEFSFLTEQK
jgi:hypothetical protein